MNSTSQSSRSGCSIWRLGAVCTALIIVWFCLGDPATDGNSKGAGRILADMHAHTVESDGDVTAEQQIAKAAEIGLKSLWISDHDVIRNLTRVRAIQTAAKQAGITVGIGVEITVSWLRKEHHLLGYFPDGVWAGDQLSPPMTTLQVAVAAVKSSREMRNSKLVQHLNAELSAPSAQGTYFPSGTKSSTFKPFTVESVAVWATAHAGLAEPASLGRPHFSKYLTQEVQVRAELVFGPRAGTGKGVLTPDGAILWDSDAVGKEGTAVDALMHSAILDAKGIAFEPLPIEEAIALINNAGGVAVVAHIPTLGPEWLKTFGPAIPSLAATGLWGIEAFSSEIDSDNHAAIARYAAESGLHTTGGSDNHGSLKVYALLGDVHRAKSPLYSDLLHWATSGVTTSNNLLRGSKTL